MRPTLARRVRSAKPFALLCWVRIVRAFTVVACEGRFVRTEARHNRVRLYAVAATVRWVRVPACPCRILAMRVSPARTLRTSPAQRSCSSIPRLIFNGPRIRPCPGWSTPLIPFAGRGRCNRNTPAPSSLSAPAMEVHSAGPERTMWTVEDLVIQWGGSQRTQFELP